MATKTNGSAGDGTTTAILLTREMIKYGLLAITNGANPVSLKKGMERAVEELIKVLKEKSYAVRGNDEIKGLACLLPFYSVNRSLTHYASLNCFHPFLQPWLHYLLEMMNMLET